MEIYHMKRIIWSVMIVIYMFTASSLVHGSTMGIFDNQKMGTDHCHTTSHPWTHKESSNTMNCCELFTSYQYSGTRIDFEHQIKIFWNDHSLRYQFKCPHIQTSTISKLLIGFSPWQNTRSKYNWFADLFGIIVHLS